MTGKMKLYIGLLVLGLALVGSGLWFLLNPSPVIEIPEDEPVIAMENLYTMAGERNRLFIYEDGTVICLEETGLRPTMNKTRTWKKGQIDEQELSTIMLFIQDVRFAELEESYYLSTTPQSDLQHIISVKYQDIDKTVITNGYFPPDSSKPYSKLPYPLDEIYQKLMDIADNRTEVVYQKSVEFTVPRSNQNAKRARAAFSYQLHITDYQLQAYQRATGDIY